MSSVEINWNATVADRDLIAQIVTRANKLREGNGHKPLKALDLTMCLVAVHMNGCPLRLAELLEADDFNLAHDVFGIYRKIDRDTGQLTDFFLPRYAVKETAKRAA